MKRTCLFCDKPANTLEHVWPQWILPIAKNRNPITQKLGDSPSVQHQGDFKIKCICKCCNNGWMSDLEAKLQPLLGSQQSHSKSRNRLILQYGQQKRRWLLRRRNRRIRDASISLPKERLSRTLYRLKTTFIFGWDVIKCAACSPQRLTFNTIWRTWISKDLEALQLLWSDASFCKFYLSNFHST